MSLSLNLTQGGDTINITKNETDNKFNWMIKNFCSLGSEKIYSDPFVTGGCKWRLLAYPKGNKTANNLSLYLEGVNFDPSPCEWRRHVKFSFKIVNGSLEKLSEIKETQHWFNEKTRVCGFSEMLSLTKVGRFLVNGHLTIVVEVDVLELIGKLDVSNESKEPSKPLKKMKLNHTGALPVNGVQDFPSQVEFESRLFEKHPDIAVGLRSKNRHLKTGFISVLFSLSKKLCQSPQELSNKDLFDADSALAFMSDEGFTLDWLEKKLDQVKENKKKEEACLARLQELEEQLKPLKQQCLDLEAQVEKEKAELLEARAPLSFDHLIS